MEPVECYCPLSSFIIESAPKTPKIKKVSFCEKCLFYERTHYSTFTSMFGVPFDVRCSVFHSMFDVRCSVFGVPFDVRCSMFGVRCSIRCSIRCSMFDVRCSVSAPTGNISDKSIAMSACPLLSTITTLE